MRSLDTEEKIFRYLNFVFKTHAAILDMTEEEIRTETGVWSWIRNVFHRLYLLNLTVDLRANVTGFQRKRDVIIFLRFHIIKMCSEFWIVCLFQRNTDRVAEARCEFRRRPICVAGANSIRYAGRWEGVKTCLLKPITFSLDFDTARQSVNLKLSSRKILLWILSRVSV